MRLLERVLVIVVAIAVTSTSLTGLAAEPPLTALAEAELALYGESSPTLSIMERIANLEMDLVGEVSDGPIINRIARITEILDTAGGNVSINLKLSTLEWFTTRAVSARPVGERVANLETLYFGGPQEGSLLSRIERLIKLTFPEGKFDVALVKVPDGQTIRIKLLTELSSATSKVGDPVEYMIVEDLRLNNRLIIPAGTQGTGKVQTVTRAGNLGRDGRVTVDFGYVRAIDGTRIPLIIDKEALEQNKSLELAAGVSLAGVLLVPPIGLVGGFFVKGKDVTIPIGTELYLQVDGPIPVGGLGEVR
ncbi:MAG: hypothetical protein GX058_00110 [Firmicutes bacterium]|nr:hypothetical protein [Bacillota bacterium]